MYSIETSDITAKCKENKQQTTKKKKLNHSYILSKPRIPVLCYNCIFAAVEINDDNTYTEYSISMYRMYKIYTSKYIREAR